MFSGNSETEVAADQNTYKILNFTGDVTFDFIEEAFEENVQVDEETETLLIEFPEPVLDGKPVGEFFANSNNDIWLVNLELVDAAPAHVNDEPNDDGDLYRLEPDMGFTISFYVRNSPSSEGQSLISIHFPKIDTAHQWSDYEHIPLSASHGIARHTAFYRLTQFHQKGSFGLNFKAEYNVPDADKARNSMAKLGRMKSD